MADANPLTALLVLWTLPPHDAAFDELRVYLRERSIPRFEQLEGLRQKTWISDPASGAWGALYLFEKRRQAEAVVAHLDESPVVTITGRTPVARMFDVEAVVEGRHSGADLLRAGLARAGD